MHVVLLYYIWSDKHCAILGRVVCLCYHVLHCIPLLCSVLHFSENVVCLNIILSIHVSCAMIKLFLSFSDVRCCGVYIELSFQCVSLCKNRFPKWHYF